MTPPPIAAIVGISGYGKIYFDRLLHHAAAGEVQIAAATVINQSEEIAACAQLRSYGCELYDDYRAMLERHRGQLDLVLIPTGIPWHRAMTVAALEAGAHVLVEKPLTASVAELATMRAASQRTGRWVAVGFQYSYHPAHRRVHAFVAGGAIGALRSIRCVGLWPRSPSYYQRNRWAGCITAHGSAVWDSPMTNGLSHFLQLILEWALIGSRHQETITEIAAELYRAQAIESYDTVAFRATTSGGAQLFFAVSHSSEAERHPEIIIEGAQGRIRWDFGKKICVCERAGQAPESFALPDDDEMRAGMFAQVLQHVRDRSVPVCTLEAAALHTRCIAAIHEHATIHDIPAKFLRYENIPGSTSPRVSIAGLDDLLLRAGDQQSLPSELAAPWSRPATRFALSSASASAAIG